MFRSIDGILIDATRQQTEPGSGDERFKLILEGTGEPRISNQNSGLEIAFLRPFCEVCGCNKCDLVVDDDALGMKAGANRRIGRKRPRIIVNPRVHRVRHGTSLDQASGFDFAGVEKFAPTQ